MCHSPEGQGGLALLCDLCSLDCIDAQLSFWSCGLMTQYIAIDSCASFSFGKKEKIVEI